MEFGLGDHSDEDINYDFPDSYYTPVNPPLVPSLPGNPDIVDLNHWQPLALQAGMPRRFLGPHWGSVTPFSLTEDDLEIFDKNQLKEFLENYKIPEFNAEYIYRRKNMAEVYFFDKPSLIDELKWII